MQNNNKNTGFSYVYSASEQAEIKRIREKYTHKSEDKMARLLRLDERVTMRAQTASLSAGIIGAFLLGFGLSLILSELGTLIGMGTALALVLGILLVIIGAALASIAYPLYNLVLRHERAKVAPEIIMLTDELMK